MNSRTFGNKNSLKDLDSLFWDDDNFFTIIYILENELIELSQVL